MISNEQQAIEMGRKFLVDAGIEILGVERVRKVNGAIRAHYIPAMPSDFWMITYSRSVSILPSCVGKTDEEREIISVFAQQHSQITVAVESDGSVEVI